MTLENLLDTIITKNASDLHLISRYYPAIRTNGQIFYLLNFNRLTEGDIEKLIFPILSNRNREILLTNKELDFSYSYNTYRFRINLYFSKGALAASFRFIPNKIKTLQETNLPRSLNNLVTMNDGIILVTGQTGQGKSTTLATLINEINFRFAKHIITIEDPIEFVNPTGKSIISQREISNDTLHWNYALKSALRQDPDVILIGEMRDQETIKSALNIAETGHLVFSTLHTITASQTVDRIISVFDYEEQNQIKTLLSASLRAVVCQKLIYSEKYNQRFPVCEILFNNNAVANLIRDGKTYLIDNVILTSSKDQMITFEKSLFNLYKQNVITKEQAIMHSIRQDEIKKLVNW